MSEKLEAIDERIALMAEQQREMHSQTMAELAELKAISYQQAESARQQAESSRQQAESARQQAEMIRQQAESSRQQAESIRTLAGAFTEQARSYREFSRNLPDIVETVRRSAQASETAAYMAQRTLEAMRDLIEELREGRR